MATKAMTMKRFQLFELTDLPWWPKSLRELLTGFLELLLSAAKPFSPKAKLLAHIMEKTKQTQFVDLCSGSGGPWLSLSEDVRRVSGKKISILLTDKYPNPEASYPLNDISNIRYSPHSVSALAVPSTLKGIRTMFNGLHHFSPDAAVSILKDAVENDQPIAIFEMLRRSWFDLFCFLLTPINVFLLTPWIRKKTLSRFVLTYVGQRGLDIALLYA